MLNEQEQAERNAKIEALIAAGEDVGDEFPVAWRAQVGAHTAEVVAEQDDCEHANPREGDQLGTMICWHPDYYLGDEQIKNEDGRGAVQHEHALSGRIRSIGTLARYCRLALNAPVVLPLYLYEHSGISMHAGTGLVVGETPSGGRDEFGSPRGWDTTLCGVIYTTPERMAELCGEGADGALYCPSDWTGTPEQWIAKQLHIEVSLYDRYLRGEVYGWRVLLADPPEDPEDEPDLADAEHVDSCWGYLPDVSETLDRELHYIQFEAVSSALDADEDRIEREQAEAVERERAANQDIATVTA